MYLHLMVYSIQPSYNVLFNHGESFPQELVANEDNGDEMSGLLAGLGGYEDLGGTSRTPLEDPLSLISKVTISLINTMTCLRK